jgi:hypothetical protein
MINYTLTDEGLQTSDAVIGSMFLGKDIKGCRLVSVVGDRWFGYEEHLTAGDGVPRYINRITIPWPTVREAIQPVEWEGCVLDDTFYESSIGWPLNVKTYNGIPDRFKQASAYHKRVLNIVTTRAELRELVARCEEAQG